MVADDDFISLTTYSEIMDYIETHKPKWVGNILFFWHNDSELFMCEGIPEGHSHGDYFDVKLKNNTPGYALVTMLNMDIHSVENVISKFEPDEHDNLPDDPRSSYNQLLSLNDVFNFYLPDEWNEIARDFWPDNGVFYTVSAIRKYIDFCNKKLLPYNGQFFTFLINGGYFGIADISMLMPAEEAIVYDSISKGSEELEYDLNEMYDIFNNSAKQSPETSCDYIILPEDRLQAIALISVNELAKHGKTICRCQNCEKYFIPSRSDALYCDNPSPKDPGMTCKEYGRQRLWYERQRQDELATLARNIASAKCMLSKRHPDIEDYAISYNYFKDNLRLWKKAVKDGQKTPDEYREWLLSMQSKTTIHNAIIQKNGRGKNG